MSGAQIRASCDAFEVTLDQPTPGDRELRVEVVFPPDGPTDSATIELRLYSRRLGWVIRDESNWDHEAAVPGTAARLERGATGRLRFTRPLPPFVTGYKGTGLEIAPVLVTEGADGSRLRTLVPLAQVGPDTYLLVRGLPRTEALEPRGMLSRLRGKGAPVHLEQPRRGVLAIAVEKGRFTGGRVRLEAVEYERNEGHYSEWDPPIVTREATLQRVGEHGLNAELALPEAIAAPASVECSWGSDTQGIRWLLRFELDGPDGKQTRGQLPLHVGAEREGASGTVGQ